MNMKSYRVLNSKRSKNYQKSLMQALKERL